MFIQTQRQLVRTGTSILSTAGNKTGGTANHTSGVHRDANIEINY